MFQKGIHLADPFDRRVEEMVSRIPPTMIVDSQPKIGPWTKNANLGIEQAFAPDANNRQTILKMPEWGFPQVWTISLGINDFVIDESTSNFNRRNITAIIEFGVGGFTQTLKVDWKVGTQVSVVTNSINVIAEFANVDAGTETAFRLSVQVARGTRAQSAAPANTLVAGPEAVGSTTPPGTTIEAIVVPAGLATGLIRIPPFANRLFFAPATVVPASIANFYSDNVVVSLESGFFVGSVVVQARRGSDLRLQNGIPVTGSALFARLTNFTADPLFVTGWVELAA